MKMGEFKNNYRKSMIKFIFILLIVIVILQASFFISMGNEIISKKMDYLPIVEN